MLTSTTTTLTYLMASIAAVSLLVGGIRRATSKPPLDALRTIP